MIPPIKIIAKSEDGEEFEIGVVSNFNVTHTRDVAPTYIIGEDGTEVRSLEPVPGSEIFTLTGILMEPGSGR